MPEDMAAVIEGAPELPATTESEQMYLITVARAAEEGMAGPVPVAALAADLAVSVASANEMVRKLAVKGLVEYLPYKGVELTDTGGRIAGRVLRTRRLWATFLAEHLDFSASEADALACHLEHVTPPDAAERLAAYLGDPRIGPLGHAIPPRSGAAVRAETVPLSGVPVGSTVEISSMPATGEIRRFLAAEGLAPGTTITVRAAGASGQLIGIGGRELHIAAEIAESIGVTSGGRDVG
jgi:DtxR family Mn-dependent transcriptional regulator